MSPSSRKPRKPCPEVAGFVASARVYGRRLLSGVADYIDRHGPWSVFVEPYSSGRFDSKWLRRWQGDGVLAFIENRQDAQRLKRLKVPIVETYGHLRDLGLPQVCSDERAIARLAAEHLLQRRFRNFAFCGYRNQPWSKRRKEGFAEAIQQAGYTCAYHAADRDHETLREWQQAREEMVEWLGEMPKPLGIMASSDRQAHDILEACRLAGLAVPEEVAVIGVDHDETLCRLSEPSLSSVADDPQRIGYEAARLLDDLMSGKRETGDCLQPQLYPPQGVVSGRSTEITIVDDPVVADALAVIHQRACENVTVNEVLNEVGVSRSILYERFNKSLGHSPHEHIMLIRLRRVQELLSHTSWSLERIAEDAGFEYPDYLGRVFRKRFGLTPGQYRKRRQAEQEERMGP